MLMQSSRVKKGTVNRPDVHFSCEHTAANVIIFLNTCVGSIHKKKTRTNIPPWYDCWLNCYFFRDRIFFFLSFLLGLGMLLALKVYHIAKVIPDEINTSVFTDIQKMGRRPSAWVCLRTVSTFLLGFGLGLVIHIFASLSVELARENAQNNHITDNITETQVSKLQSTTKDKH